MTEIEGDLPFFEGAVVSKALGRRVLGSLRFAWLGVVLVAMACGGAFGGWLAAEGDDLPGWVTILAVAGFATVAVGGLVAANRALRRAIRRRWFARGVPETGHVRVRITDDALRIEAVTATTSVPWRYVSEIAHEKRHVIFVVAGMGYFVPRRFFASPADETAFVSAALERLEPGARGRSRTAGRV